MQRHSLCFAIQPVVKRIGYKMVLVQSLLELLIILTRYTVFRYPMQCYALDPECMCHDSACMFTS